MYYYYSCLGIFGFASPVSRMTSCSTHILWLFDNVRFRLKRFDSSFVCGRLLNSVCQFSMHSFHCRNAQVCLVQLLPVDRKPSKSVSERHVHLARHRLNVLDECISHSGICLCFHQDFSIFYVFGIFKLLHCMFTSETSQLKYNRS